MHTRLSLGLATVLVPVALALAPAMAQTVPAIASGFDNGSTDGWTAIAAVVAQGQATGGNPGGCLFVDNDDASPFCRLLAPPAFLGDLRSYYGGTLSFDGKLAPGSSGTQSAAQYDYGRVFLVDSQGYSISADAAPGVPSATAWTTYSLTLLPTTFGVSQAQLDHYLQDCTAIRIGMEALSGPEAHFVDNITLAANATPAAALPAGSGCVGSGGATVLEAFTLPWIGTTCETRANGFPTVAVRLTVGVFGLSALPGLPLASVLPQGVAGCNLYASPDVLLANVQIGAYTAWLFPVPNNPALVGGSYWHQAVPFDLDGGGNVTQISASNAFRMLIGVR